MQPPATIAVVGPTASGKSDLALALARRLGGEIVSVDSMQVYRGMDIGTAKPDATAQAEIRHHMLDLCDPEDEYSVAQFQIRGREVIASLHAAGRTAIIAGGSGLHFRSLVDPLEFPPTDPEIRARLEALPISQVTADLVAADPAAGERVDLDNPRRVVRAMEVLQLTGLTPSERTATAAACAVRAYEADIPFVGVGIDPGPGLQHRAKQRLGGMLEAGLLDEVTQLAPRLGVNAAQAVGYRELLPVVAGDTDLAAASEATLLATLALAKRQRTYFGRDPRIDWLVWDDDPERRQEAAWRKIEEQLWSS